MSAAAAGGTALSVYGDYMSAELEAQANEQKAYIKKLQAGEIMAAAERDAGLTIEKGKAVKSAQISAFGRSGVDISGSPLLQVSTTMTNARSDAEAQLRAGRYRAFTSNYEADLQSYFAKETRTAGQLKAVSSLLTGGSGMASASGGL